MPLGAGAALVARATSWIQSTCAADAGELFRRMCFNALISNIDDHPRNHAIIARERDWRLSPAYDLTPSVPVGLERRDLALMVGDAGRYANAETILSQCERFLLRREEATKIVDEMERRVREGWYKAARQVGVSERDCERISGTFRDRRKSPRSLGGLCGRGDRI